MEKPICPECNEEMIIKRYTGYYDQLFYWACKCTGKSEHKAGEPEEIFSGAHTGTSYNESDDNRPEKVS